MVDHNESVTLQRKPAIGLIPRGVVGREFNTGRIEWQVSKGDLLQAHKMHMSNARAYRELGDSTVTACHLNAAALVRGYLTKRKPLRTLDLLRGKA